MQKNPRSILFTVIVFLSFFVLLTMTGCSVNSDVQGEAIKTQEYFDATFDVASEIPNRTNKDEVSLDINVESTIATSIITKKDDKIIAETSINGSTTSVKLSLNDGYNLFKFQLTNKDGGLSKTERTAEITLDKTPPKIYKFCDSATGKPVLGFDMGSEWVCVSMGQFNGVQYGVAYSPVYGGTGDNISSVSIDGKTLNFGPNHYINQRVPVRVSLGTNLYEIVAKDDLGNTATDRYELSWEDTSSRNNEQSNTSSCCKVCTTGKACGNSCISKSYTCHQPPGCACDY